MSRENERRKHKILIKIYVIVLVTAVGNWGPSEFLRIVPLLLDKAKGINFCLVWG